VLGRGGAQCSWHDDGREALQYRRRAQHRAAGLATFLGSQAGEERRRRPQGGGGGEEGLDDRDSPELGGGARASASGSGRLAGVFGVERNASSSRARLCWARSSSMRASMRSSASAKRARSPRDASSACKAESSASSSASSDSSAPRSVDRSGGETSGAGRGLTRPGSGAAAPGAFAAEPPRTGLATGRVRSAFSAETPGTASAARASVVAAKGGHQRAGGSHAGERRS